VTAPARTLIDLAGVTDAVITERALNEARVRKLVSDAEIYAALDRCRGRTGTAMIRGLLQEEAETGFSRSEAERRLQSIIEQARLPRPHMNARVAGYEVDAVWPAARLVVEVDGYRFHGHPAAFERDRRKDQDLAAAGYQVIRVTWRQLNRQPLLVAARIAQALGRAGPGPEAV
jgi:very-short-patch-repair endonuclease